MRAASASAEKDTSIQSRVRSRRKRLQRSKALLEGQRSVPEFVSSTVSREHKNAGVNSVPDLVHSRARTTSYQRQNSQETTSVTREFSSTSNLASRRAAFRQTEEVFNDVQPVKPSSNAPRKLSLNYIEYWNSGALQRERDEREERLRRSVSHEKSHTPDDVYRGAKSLISAFETGQALHQTKKLKPSLIPQIPEVSPRKEKSQPVEDPDLKVSSEFTFTADATIKLPPVENRKPSPDLDTVSVSVTLPLATGDASSIDNLADGSIYFTPPPLPEPRPYTPVHSQIMPDIFTEMAKSLYELEAEMNNLVPNYEPHRSWQKAEMTSASSNIKVLQHVIERAMSREKLAEKDSAQNLAKFESDLKKKKVSFDILGSLSALDKAMLSGRESAVAHNRSSLYRTANKSDSRLHNWANNLSRAELSTFLGLSPSSIHPLRLSNRHSAVEVVCSENDATAEANPTKIPRIFEVKSVSSPEQQSEEVKPKVKVDVWKNGEKKKQKTTKSKDETSPNKRTRQRSLVRSKPKAITTKEAAEENLFVSKHIHRSSQDAEDLVVKILDPAKDRVVKVEKAIKSIPVATISISKPGSKTVQPTSVVRRTQRTQIPILNKDTTISKILDKELPILQKPTFGKPLTSPSIAVCHQTQKQKAVVIPGTKVMKRSSSVPDNTPAVIPQPDQVIIDLLNLGNELLQERRILHKKRYGSTYQPPSAESKKFNPVILTKPVPQRAVRMSMEDIASRGGKIIENVMQKSDPAGHCFQTATSTDQSGSSRPDSVVPTDPEIYHSSDSHTPSLNKIKAHCSSRESVQSIPQDPVFAKTMIPKLSATPELRPSRVTARGSPIAPSPLDAATRQINDFIDGAKRQHTSDTRSHRFRRAMRQLDSVYETLQQECNFADTRSFGQRSPSYTHSRFDRSTSRETRESSLPQPPKRNDSIEKFVDHFQSMNDSNRPLTLATVHVEKMDFTRKWLDGNLSALKEDEPQGPSIVPYSFRDFDEDSMGSGSVEVAAITNKSRPSKPYHRLTHQIDTKPKKANTSYNEPVYGKQRHDDTGATKYKSGYVPAYPSSVRSLDHKPQKLSLHHSTKIESFDKTVSMNDLGSPRNSFFHGKPRDASSVQRKINRYEAISSTEDCNINTSASKLSGTPDIEGRTKSLAARFQNITLPTNPDGTRSDENLSKNEHHMATSRRPKEIKPLCSSTHSLPVEPHHIDRMRMFNIAEEPAEVPDLSKLIDAMNETGIMASQAALSMSSVPSKKTRSSSTLTGGQTQSVATRRLILHETPRVPQNIQKPNPDYQKPIHELLQSPLDDIVNLVAELELNTQETDVPETRFPVNEETRQDVDILALPSDPTPSDPRLVENPVAAAPVIESYENMSADNVAAVAECYPTNVSLRRKREMKPISGTPIRCSYPQGSNSNNLVKRNPLSSANSKGDASALYSSHAGSSNVNPPTMVPSGSSVTVRHTAVSPTGSMSTILKQVDDVLASLDQIDVRPVVGQKIGRAPVAPINEKTRSSDGFQPVKPSRIRPSSISSGTAPTHRQPPPIPHPRQHPENGVPQERKSGGDIDEYFADAFNYEKFSSPRNSFEGPPKPPPRKLHQSLSEDASSLAISDIIKSEPIVLPEKLPPTPVETSRRNPMKSLLNRFRTPSKERKHREDPSPRMSQSYTDQLKSNNSSSTSLDYIRVTNPTEGIRPHLGVHHTSSQPLLLSSYGIDATKPDSISEPSNTLSRRKNREVVDPAPPRPTKKSVKQKVKSWATPWKK